MDGAGDVVWFSFWNGKGKGKGMSGMDDQAATIKWP